MTDLSNYKYLPNDFDPAAPDKTAEPEWQERNQPKVFFQSFCKNKLAVCCAVLLLVLVLASLLAPLSPFDPDQRDLLNKFAPPSKVHLFGTDELGRDYFTRALYGGRASITVGFCSMLFAVFIGTVYGAVSGYVGGLLDTLLMRFVDIFVSIPSLLLIIVINTFIEPSLMTTILMIGLFAWPGVARIVRADTLSIKEREFVMAAKNLGVSHGAIIMRHILPNLISQIVIAATITVARSIIMESTISFLGYGIQIPKASWGGMLQDAQQYILTTPMLAVIPGLLILLTVLSFNVLGDELQKIFEPRLSE